SAYTVSAIKSTAVWSADGRYFVFVGYPTSFGTNCVFLFDAQTRTTNLVSINSNHTGAAYGVCDMPTISGDGRFVMYRSTAISITPLPGTNVPNLYIYDRLTGSNSLLAATESSWRGWKSKPTINGDGRIVIFQGLGSALSTDVETERGRDL